MKHLFENLNWRDGIIIGLIVYCFVTPIKTESYYIPFKGRASIENTKFVESLIQAGKGVSQGYDDIRLKYNELVQKYNELLVSNDSPEVIDD